MTDYYLCEGGIENSVPPYEDRCLASRGLLSDDKR